MNFIQLTKQRERGNTKTFDLRVLL